MLSVYCDGGARGNPGPAAIGVVVKNNSGNILAAFGQKIGIATNNVAEYTAVVESLAWIGEQQYHITHITCFLDSQLVVSQLTGIYRIKDSKLRLLLMQVREKEAIVGGNIFYKHIPRESNREADALVNRALDEKI